MLYIFLGGHSEDSINGADSCVYYIAWHGIARKQSTNTLVYSNIIIYMHPVLMLRGTVFEKLTLSEAGKMITLWYVLVSKIACSRSCLHVSCAEAAALGQRNDGSRSKSGEVTTSTVHVQHFLTQSPRHGPTQ